MARRTVYLHLGPAGSGALDAALLEHAEALAEEGVQHPVTAEGEMFRAAVEIRRDHQAWGLRRRDVEGTWAEICRRARKGHGPVVVSHELLLGCTDDQVALLLDTLGGFEIHAVLTTRQADARTPDLEAVVARWSHAVGSPDRVHLLVAPDGADVPTWAWPALGDLVGYDATRMPLPQTALPPYLVRSLAQAVGREVGVDAPASAEDQLWWTASLLSATLVEVSRLREHEKELVERNERLERKRGKLKRRLAAVE